MTEQWRAVVGYESTYEVSDLGNVRRSGPAATVAVASLRRERFGHQETIARLASFRQHVACTLDDLRAAQRANQVLLGDVAERDTTIVKMAEEHERSSLAIMRLIKSLNATNARCAEMQQALHAQGIISEPGYFLAMLGDGSIAGPFGRN